MSSETRPWGSYEILHESGNYKVKKITVNPGQRLSYQYHEKRHEHWYIIQGDGILTLNGIKSSVCAGNPIDIKVKVKHRIECTSSEPLIFIEIQRGEYLGEDDIIRLDDDYGRADESRHKEMVHPPPYFKPTNNRELDRLSSSYQAPADFGAGLE
jgi:mannose-6-phosphate isomerase